MKRLLLLFVLALMLPSCFGDSEGSSSTNDLLAFNYSTEFVKQRLKSPSTAKFPGTFEKRDYITKVSDDKYIIDAWVDSQNGFGLVRSAPLRNHL